MRCVNWPALAGGRRRLLGVAALALLVAACAPAAARADGYQVGTGMVDVTPPPQSSGAEGDAFKICPPGLDGDRPFAFEEPYKDLNGNGHFDYADPAAGTPQEPYCDANANGRYDGIYISSGVYQLAAVVHDPIDARAVAFSDGAKTVVLVSVVSQGIFNAYQPDETLGTKDMRARAQRLRPGIGDVIVSSNHNESSPDPIGIYGAPDGGGSLPAGANSGIDDSYMNRAPPPGAQGAAPALTPRAPPRL